MSIPQQLKPGWANGDDFTNNFISDLGPLLALFGEQVAKQFMSESMGWADNIIFAMGPLGIITAIVGAIRVGGPSWLKAIIGRARENRAVAEVELMSSTSHEVCELWNGQQIVRILGSPEIRELVQISGDDGTALYTLEQAVKDNKVNKVKGGNRFQMLLQAAIKKLPSIFPKAKKPLKNPEDSSPDAPQKPTVASAPNISLNIHSHSKRGELHIVAAIGIILQSLVLIYGGFATYHPRLEFQKGDLAIESYAFPLTSIGTFFLVAGMMVCSYVIERSTKEESYRVGDTAVHILWLQKVATVGDQEFDSYAIFAKDKRDLITTSRRDNQNDSSNPEQHVNSTSSELLASIGTIISLCGFFAQFIGLRGMHWSVTITQLAVTFIMSVLRAWVRRGLAKRPYVQLLPAKHEIDWLATRASQYDQLWGGSGDAPSSYWQNLWNWVCMREAEHKPEEKRHFWTPNCFDWGIRTGENNSEYQPLKSNIQSHKIKRTHEVVQTRKELGWLTKWPGPAFDHAISVATSIELIMNTLFILGDGNIDGNINEFFWTMNAPGDELIAFKLERPPGGKWAADVTEIEAALSLWLYSVRENEQATRTNNDSKSAWLRSGMASKRQSLRLLGKSTESTRRDMKWWMGSGISRVLQVEALPTTTTDAAADDVDTIIFENHRVVGSRNMSSTSAAEALDGNQKLGTRKYKIQQFPSDAINIQKEMIDPATANNPQSSRAQGAQLSLATISDSPLGLLFAQDMFSAFMWAVAKSLDQKTVLELFGQATVQQATERASLDNNTAWRSFTLQNPKLLKIVQGVQRTGLGSLEEVYMSIIPPLSAEDKLPEACAVIELAREEAKRQEYAGNWGEAGEVYLWAFRTCMTFGSSHAVAVSATIAMAELIRSISMMETERENQRRATETTTHLRELRLALSSELRESADDDILSELASMYEIQDRTEGYDEWKPILIQKTTDTSIKSQLFRQTPLHEAILKRAEDEYKKLILEGIYLNTKDILGWTPLHYAAHLGDKNAVSKLLEGYADQNSIDNAGWTPLHYATWAQGREPEIGLLLLHNGAEVDIHGRDGFTPLHCASRSDNMEMAKILIRSGARLVALDSTRRTPLHWAAYSGSKEVVELLLQQEAYLDLPDGYRRTPLHLAASKGHEDIVRMFLESSDVDQETKDQDGLTAIHLAARGGYEGVVKIFLEKGMGTGRTDQVGRTALHMAASLGYVSLIKELLDVGVDKDANDEDGCTALHYAADRGHDVAVKVLVEAKANNDAKDTEGLTALHRAAKNGHTETVKVLLGGGVDEEAGGAGGLTALDWAAMEGYSPTMRILLEGENGMSSRARCAALHWAASNGYGIAVHTFLENGIEISVRDQDGSTVLHKAAENGHGELVKLFLERGLDISAKDQNGSTALHKATENGHESLIMVLLENGSDISGKDMDGRTALHKAACNRYETLVEKLLEKGADISAKDQHGSTALHGAAYNGYENVVKVLIERGADISAEDHEGWTALHEAARNGHEVVVKTLLERGINIATRNKHFSTALHLAASNGHEAVIKVFLDQDDIDTELKDKDGFTPLELADNGGHGAVVEILSSGYKELVERRTFLARGES